MPKIKIGNKTRQAKLTIGAVKRFKVATGKNLLQMEKTSELEAEEIAQLIFCCLGPKPDITLEEIEEGIDIQGLPGIFTELLSEKGQGAQGKDPLSSSGR